MKRRLQPEYKRSIGSQEPCPTTTQSLDMKRHYLKRWPKATFINDKVATIIQTKHRISRVSSDDSTKPQQEDSLKKSGRRPPFAMPRLQPEYKRSIRSAELQPTTTQSPNKKTRQHKNAEGHLLQWQDCNQDAREILDPQSVNQRQRKGPTRRLIKKKKVAGGHFL